MSTQISTPVKVFALVALVLALGMGGMMLMQSGSSSSSSSPPPVTVTHPTPPAATSHAPTPASTSHAATTATKPAATKPAASKPKASKHAATAPAAGKPSKPAASARTHAAASAKPATKPKTKTKPKAKGPAVAANGLPTALDELLHIHRVVVVAVWDPEVPTDKLFLDEAQAGAKDAKVGFLPVSVLDERVAGPLTAAAGNGSLLPSPGLLIYKQPATLMNTITGFVDRTSVAEAAANAQLGEAPAQTASPSTTTGAAP